MDIRIPILERWRLRRGSSKKTPIRKNLERKKLPRVAANNLSALLARPCMKTDFRTTSIKVQNPTYAKLRKEHRYYGAVDVSVSGIQKFEMLNMDDDMVAYVYFYFGQDSYESLSVFLFSQFSKKVDVILDIGAFTGLFGLVAAVSNPHSEVFSFEPIPAIADRARFNKEINGLSNYNVVVTAITDRSGYSNLTLFGGNQATTGASLVQKKQPKNVGKIRVALDTIDGFIAKTFPEKPVGLIKLDTEGDEANAIKGAEKVLQSHQPLIVSEVLNQDALIQQVSLVAKYGYETSFIDDKNRRLLPVFTDGSFTEFQLIKFGYGNIVSFIPGLHRSYLGEVTRRFQDLA